MNKYTLAKPNEKSLFEKAKDAIKEAKDQTARRGRAKIYHVAFTSTTENGKTVETFEMLNSRLSFSPTTCVESEETKKIIKEHKKTAGK